MQKIELEVKPRDLGEKDKKRNLNQLRREGWIPAVLYGHGDPVAVSISERLFQKATHDKVRASVLFNIKLGSDTSLGVIKEVQRHLLTHKPIHIDFQRINVKEKIEISIPTHVVGESPGVKNQGGILEHIQREIRLRCLPDDIPASLDVDVSQLELGHGIKVQDLKIPKGVEFLTPGDHIVVNVVAAKVEEVAPVTPAIGAEGAVAAAQPEVIAKGKKEEEGAAGAAAAPAGKGAPAAGKAGAPQAAAEKGEKKK